jgi:ubiquinone biosynthesis protein COQ9
VKFHTLESYNIAQEPMSASRGLSLWRLARAAPRAASLAKPSYPAQRLLPLATQTFTYPSPRRLLSSQTNSDPPGFGSIPPGQEPESNQVSAEIPDSDATSDPKLTSDPELTSDSDSSSSESSELDECSVVLEAALGHVPALGWTPAALEEGARDMGLTHVIEDMFPRGGGELVDYFDTVCNSDLVDFLKQRAEEDSVKGPQLLEEAVEHRLRMIIPHINNWPQAMALKAFPVNAPTALENLGLLVDDVWHYAGDRSTDFSWYTKRALLATIYTSTEVFMVQDSSVDFKETWKFLHRRMEDADTFGKASKEFQGLVSGGVETFSAGLNSALNAFGMKGR